MVSRNAKAFVVVDGVSQKEYEKVFPLFFSPNSKRYAYFAGQGDEMFVVVDGVEGEKYDSIFLISFVFSPDSMHVAYMARRSGKEFAVVDGIEQTQYDHIIEMYTHPILDSFDAESGKLVFSSDSKHLAYAAQRGSWQDSIAIKKLWSSMALREKNMMK